MLEIKNTKTYGLNESIMASGYPTRYGEPENMIELSWGGMNITDEKRAIKLGNVLPGTGHDNFLKGMAVQFDLKYSLYFTKQLQRYTFMNFVSSQSTMHTITKRKDITEFCNNYVDIEIIGIINRYIKAYNAESDENKKHNLFMKIVSNLPCGFELWARMTTNYLQLKTIYNQRKNHKLEDWHIFCDWIKSLPKSEYFIDE